MTVHLNAGSLSCNHCGKRLRQKDTLSWYRNEQVAAQDAFRLGWNWVTHKDNAGLKRHDLWCADCLAEVDPREYVIIDRALTAFPARESYENTPVISCNFCEYVEYVDSPEGSNTPRNALNVVKDYMDDKGSNRIYRWTRLNFHPSDPSADICPSCTDHIVRKYVTSSPHTTW